MMEAYQCMKVVAVIFLATLTLGTTFEAKAQMGVGSVIPALIWKDGTVKRNVTIQQLAGNTIILKVDGRLTPIAKQDFLKLYGIVPNSVIAYIKENNLYKQLC